MKDCPECKYTRAYRLSDGRRKCRRCGFRYSWTSVWDSIRLPEPAKRRLLKHFVTGVPAYQLKQHSGVSLKSHERFNRVLRACCAIEEGVSPELCNAEVVSLPEHAGASQSPKSRPAELHGVVFQLTERDGRVMAAPDPAGRQVVPRAVLEERQESGPLESGGPGRARVMLWLRGGRVVCANSGSRSRWPAAGNPIEEFCHFAMEWMQPYGSVRREYFHLYMGEICCRFNHRNAALEPWLLRQLRSRSIQKLRPLLTGKLRGKASRA